MSRNLARTLLFIAVGTFVLLLLMSADVSQERAAREQFARAARAERVERAAERAAERAERAERLAGAAQVEIPPDVDTASGWKIEEHGASLEAVLSGAHLTLMVICVEGRLDGVLLEGNQFDPEFDNGVVDLWFDDGEAEMAVWSGGLVPAAMYRRMLDHRHMLIRLRWATREQVVQAFDLSGLDRMGCRP